MAAKGALASAASAPSVFEDTLVDESNRKSVARALSYDAVMQDAQDPNWFLKGQEASPGPSVKNGGASVRASYGDMRRPEADRREGESGDEDDSRDDGPSSSVGAHQVKDATFWKYRGFYNPIVYWHVGLAYNLSIHILSQDLPLLQAQEWQGQGFERGHGLVQDRGWTKLI